MTRAFGTSLVVVVMMGQPSSATSVDDRSDCRMPDAVRVWTAVAPAAVRTRVEPKWPAILQAAKVQGTVVLDVWIDAQGRVACVRVLRSIPLLDAAVVAAVQHWTFTPARVNNRPIAVIQPVAVSYPPPKPH